MATMLKRPDTTEEKPQGHGAGRSGSEASPKSPPTTSPSEGTRRHDYAKEEDRELSKRDIIALAGSIRGALAKRVEDFYHLADMVRRFLVDWREAFPEHPTLSLCAKAELKLSATTVYMLAKVARFITLEECKKIGIARAHLIGHMSAPKDIDKGLKMALAGKSLNQIRKDVLGVDIGAVTYVKARAIVRHLSPQDRIKLMRELSMPAPKKQGAEGRRASAQ